MTKDEMTDCITDSMDVNLRKLGDCEGQENLVCVHGVAKSHTRLRG